ncbi:hypothetical protein SDJN03_03181, partial [Cucurbita argyrosperma subsp. sororia]
MALISMRNVLQKHTPGYNPTDYGEYPMFVVAHRPPTGRQFPSSYTGFEVDFLLELGMAGIGGVIVNCCDFCSCCIEVRDACCYSSLLPFPCHGAADIGGSLFICGD